MQSHTAVSSSPPHHDLLGSTNNGRQLSMTTQYNSSSYGNGHYGNYMNTSPTSPYDSQPRSVHGWQSTLSDASTAPSRSHGYGHVESSSYGLSGMQRQHSHSRSGQYYPQVDNAAYDSQRTMSYSSHHDRYRVSPPASIPHGTYGSSYSSYGAVPPSHPSASLHSPPATSGSEARCEWGDRRCAIPLEDSSPSGIARHLRQYHDISVTDNRTRAVCMWGGRCCKDMFPSSFGKHIAECHLRNMTKQCPHCGADFARADTLSRHIKAFCPHTTGANATQAYSSS
ncbi:hypothetical protein C8Q76DRAFT_735778 [Earliella scabrosa]|nr:hypothetical protein C8Q76DRAFT_735778 [Earliella scabrosa]